MLSDPEMPGALRRSKMLQNDGFSLLFVSVSIEAIFAPGSTPLFGNRETEEGEAQRRPERTRSPYYA